MTADTKPKMGPAMTNSPLDYIQGYPIHLHSTVSMLPEMVWHAVPDSNCAVCVRVHVFVSTLSLVCVGVCVYLSMCMSVCACACMYCLTDPAPRLIHSISSGPGS